LRARTQRAEYYTFDRNRSLSVTTKPERSLVLLRVATSLTRPATSGKMAVTTQALWLSRASPQLNVLVRVFPVQASEGDGDAVRGGEMCCLSSFSRALFRLVMMSWRVWLEQVYLEMLLFHLRQQRRHTLQVAISFHPGVLYLLLPVSLQMLHHLHFFFLLFQAFQSSFRSQLGLS